MKNQVYSQPKLCKSPKGWYVYIVFNGKQKRFKQGLNYIKSEHERNIEANALIAALTIRLKQGWDPFTGDLFQQKQNLNIIQALEFALEKKKANIEPKTYSGYKGTVDFLTRSINKIGIGYLPITDLKRIHIRTILAEAVKMRNWSNNARNKHLNHLKSLLTELLEWDILEYNPAHKINNLKVDETNANIPTNEKEHAKIKKCLESEYPYFYNFICTIFHTGIRPKEILQIKLSDIDLNNQVINLKANTTKTRKSRTVPINNHLLNIFEQIELHNYPSDFYLFGSYREKGKGNVGKFIDFIPGPTNLKRDTATKRWKKIVKDGLGINVNMYSYKHKGGDEKIKAGISLDALRNQYGHKNPRMTEVYAKEIKNVYKNEIINKSPEF